MNKWLSDRVDYNWQIAKLESWHWGVAIYIQIVTWTAFAILAMFVLESRLSDDLFGQRKLNSLAPLNNLCGISAFIYQSTAIAGHLNVHLSAQWCKMNEYLYSHEVKSNMHAQKFFCTSNRTCQSNIWYVFALDLWEHQYC